LPTSINELFAAATLQPAGVVRWGERVPEGGKGVYVVALTESNDECAETFRPAPISRKAVGQLLEARPELRLDGKRPTSEELAARLGSFWANDEIALYVGRAGRKDRERSLRARVREYYGTPLGARRPHSGGWFVKMLLNLSHLYVHYAAADDPEEAEGAMIRAYGQRLSDGTRGTIRDPAHPFPFANLEYPPRVYKLHGITGARGDTR
jgi:hypothetical protein